MNKTHRYNFLSLSLTLVFIFGSMMGMDYILQVREKQLLTQSGSAVVESPVRAWENWENGEKSDGTEISDNERRVLTDWQIVDAIKCWDSREVIILHSPVEGQVSMEEAIASAEKWLMKMGLLRENEQKTKMETDETNFTTATLGVGKRKGDMGEQLEPYYSFWTVQCSNHTMSAILFLNAVTGKVWSAEITLYEEQLEKLPYENLDLFVEMAGLQASDESPVIIDTQGTQAVLELEGGMLYAHAKYRHVLVKDNDNMQVLGIEDYGSNMQESGMDNYDSNIQVSVTDKYNNNMKHAYFVIIYKIS